MSFYKYKRDANLAIDKMLAEGLSMTEIEFKISTLYGFGRKFIDKRVELLKRMRKERDVPE